MAREAGRRSALAIVRCGPRRHLERDRSRSKLVDEDLIQGLAAAVTRGRANDAALLAYLAEVDERRLYLPARCARRFPPLCAAVDDGRLHLTAVIMIAPHLTAENVDERVGAATHRSKRELEVIIAAWAPRLDVPERLEPLLAPLAGIEMREELAPARVTDVTPPPATRTTPLAPENAEAIVTRYVPAEVRRVVHERDGEQCTF